MGTTACGEYEGMVFYGEGGQFKQSSPMQMGFSGNNLQGIRIVSSNNIELGNIEINNLKSDYGERYALSIWTANDIKVKEDTLIIVSKIHTGQMIKHLEYELNYDSNPNRSPEACGIRLETDTTSEMYDSKIKFLSKNAMKNIGVYVMLMDKKCVWEIQMDYHKKQCMEII